MKKLVFNNLCNTYTSNLPIQDIQYRIEILIKLIFISLDLPSIMHV